MRKSFAPLLLIAIFIILPFVVKHPYYQHLMILVLMWIAIGSGWNLISGYTGQVLFGAACFFGIGAYTAALLAHKLDISAWWGLPLGALVSVLLAFPFGWICFRLRGPYFALATLALNEILRNLATVWESLTEGMVGILIMQTFVSKIPYYFVALALAVGSLVLVHFVMQSRWGYYFVSIREDQDAAESMGINTLFFKMLSLCLSSLLIGLAGALYTVYMGFIDPKVVFSLHDISIMAILVGIVGGVGTVYGPAVGAFIMVAVQEIFRTAGFGLLPYLGKTTGWPFMATVTKYVSEAHVLSFGVLVILVILYLPNGIVGDWNVVKKKLIFWQRSAI
ncbi:MAG: branched-chain amino acid ABC transporter permease [Desulfomonilaceae bacterium]